ncbi:GvpL/GvpF family gas vesicle protein [Prauserella oleivorans]|uniref:GvpL/GvpF family gas vesicle protein n=1 Tax=Prauserella oleivorans TaxID=1478153 RepID=A0ABW5WB88_9PSEU
MAADTSGTEGTTGTASAEHTEGIGRWLYVVARSLDHGVLEGLRGVAGEPVHAIENEDLVALVSPASLDEFGEEALHRNLEDLDWLAETARAHDDVVAAADRAAAAVVPLRLATVYLDDDRVRSLLAQRRADFAAALDLVAGRTEWGVKAYADPDELVAAAEPTAGSGGGAGTAYLLKRKAQLSARERAEQAAADHAGELHEALAALSVAARRHPPQDPKLSGRSGWMVLNGAYLVDDARGDEFARTVERLGADRAGVRLELTGPWPPYSFAGLEENAG